MYHNVGLVQGVPDHEQVIAPVCTDLYSAYILSIGLFVAGEPR
jgi:hypothetical protein